MELIKYSISGTVKYELDHKYEGDGTYDVYLQNDVIIKPFETVAINTGIILELPEGVHAMYVPRSSTSLKGLYVANCVIDSNYRGTSHIILTNLSNETHEFGIGERVASLMFYDGRFEKGFKLKKVEEFEINKNSKRGDKKFGSTGRN